MTGFGRPSRGTNGSHASPLPAIPGNVRDLERAGNVL